MISALWLLPLVVGVIGIVPLYRGSRRLDSDLAELRSAITRLHAVRPALSAVTAEAQVTRRAVEDLARQYTQLT